jgi:hypothetical protein
MSALPTVSVINTWKKSNLNRAPFWKPSMVGFVPKADARAAQFVRSGVLE